MSTVFIAILAAALVLLVASWAHYVYWVRRLTLDLPYEVEERLPTADGCFVELRRLPREDGVSDGPPVLLVHGLALNHRNNDLTEDISLGRYLARRGHDVWLLTLRSGRDDLSWREEKQATFETMARHDLGVGIDAVLARTGAERVDYVGFSMGGMLMYAAAGRTVTDDVLRRVVIIGSPAEIRPPLSMIAVIARFIPHWLVPTLRLRLVSRFMAFAADLVHTPIHRWIYNTENVERGMAGYALTNGFVNIPSGLAAELVRFASDAGTVTFDGAPVLPALRGRVAPALFVAGADDRLAPPDTVRLAFDAWGADVDTQKDFRVVGVETGAAADYGHGDLAIGRFVDQDVFEPVHAFLSAESLVSRVDG
ncbi:MAG: alpha/beta fold hydrolase [Myxococcales bacterium]|nr:alpha/beta fold hydrolase [Myxococcales bacterium]